MSNHGHRFGFFRLLKVCGREIVGKIEKLRGHCMCKYTDIGLRAEEKKV